jgi:heme-degrading monooxygenase HmoA
VAFQVAADRREVIVILEVAILHVKQDASAQFEAAFAEAQPIIVSMPGYLGHELHRCIETKNKYLLLVRWRNVADHEQGFRSSSEYRRWKALRHHFYDPFPTVEHFERVHGSAMLDA